MTALNPVEVNQHLVELLSAATAAHRSAQQIAAEHARHWKELIVDAVDAGVRIRDVAPMAGVSVGRIHAIIINVCSQPEEAPLLATVPSPTAHRHSAPTTNRSQSAGQLKRARAGGDRSLVRSEPRPRPAAVRDPAGRYDGDELDGLLIERPDRTRELGVLPSRSEGRCLRA